MWSTLFTRITKHKYPLIACLVILAYLMPYYVLGEDTHIRVHDNLDSNIVWYKLLADSGHIFTLKDVALPNVINGLPRSTLPSGLDAMVWLYVLFKPITAYIIGQTIMRFVAFFGMYLLLKKNLLKSEHKPLITAGAALGFALLPYWPSGLLSIAGLPLALHIFLTIRSQGKTAPKYYWITLFLIPFFSNFVLTFVFFLSLMGLFWLIDWIRKKRINWPFFAAIAGMTSIYLIKNYLLIYSMFFENGFTSHRSELNLGHKDLPGTFDLFLHNLINGHTHDLSIHFLIIFPVIGLALLVAAYRKLNPKQLLAFFLFNVFLSLWYALWYWEGWRVVKDNFMVANTFNFSRIHFFDPAIWYICFAIGLTILWKHFKFFKPFVVVLIIVQCTMLFQLNEETKYGEIGTPTFKQFYAVELFQEIEDYIGKDQSTYRVVSIGMHPTIAQYNGFYTLDTYNNSYPLVYKHKFRKVIAPELNKNPSLKSYYDTWGGRAYMFVDELGKHYMFGKNSKKTIENLAINTDALKDLGGEYIFSALPIENYRENGLQYERNFVKNGLPWQVYLYRVMR
ncbi:putative membrane protein YkoS [Lentibacillus populi]|uniref:Membrane protein YkoS n=1 Tax=Lentibacillus populi TaxID=1827502 RepID=A0A9W5TWT3_9BACI|nr:MULTISPECIES: DUF6044 family protein [Bacillaceae]MBT2218213.1 hypothetical protein [Virgibacillus dakarensis]GGB37805.1 putative membrane protein YkoS [Lentibacillus populi]